MVDGCYETGVPIEEVVSVRGRICRTVISSTGTNNVNFSGQELIEMKGNKNRMKKPIVNNDGPFTTQ